VIISGHPVLASLFEEYVEVDFTCGFVKTQKAAEGSLHVSRFDVSRDTEM